MVEVIKQFLKKQGYSSVFFEVGKNGYFIYAITQWGTQIFDLRIVVNEILKEELKTLKTKKPTTMERRIAKMEQLIGIGYNAGFFDDDDLRILNENEDE